MREARRLSGSEASAGRWSHAWRRHWQESEVLLLLAATETAAVPGISAAGATPEARRVTAAADAELLVLGPAAHRVHPLPPLAAGVSPALIGHVVLRTLGLRPLVVDLGCAVAPALPHLRLPPPAGAGPARCLSGGAAMDPERVTSLLALGRRWSRSGALHGAARPLLVAECVPGGTTTALGVLQGLGVQAEGLVSGSLRRSAHGAKAALVRQGLRTAGRATLAPGGDGAAEAIRMVAALGDPMQPLAAALALGAAAAGRPVLLAGGSQMAAVLALALALAPASLRPRLAETVAVGTTAWVADESGSDVVELLGRIGARWGVEPLAFATHLRFTGPCHPALADYERGYVKEGVGAGGMALLWELSGRTPRSLARSCDRACRTLLGPGGAGHLRSAHG